MPGLRPASFCSVGVFGKAVASLRTHIDLVAGERAVTRDVIYLARNRAGTGKCERQRHTGELQPVPTCFLSYVDCAKHAAVARIGMAKNEVLAPRMTRQEQTR